MKSIFKYSMNIVDFQTIWGPFLKILHVGPDPNGHLCLWAEVDPDASPFSVGIFIVGTGRDVPEKAKYHITTILTPPYMWHVYTNRKDLICKE